MNIDALVGLTLSSCFQRGEDEIIFITSEGREFMMYHKQDCCENVTIEDIVGDLADLIGTPIIEAREDSQDDPDASGEGEWTFYNFRTIKGSVTIRWYGSSNGWYSVAVNFAEITS